MKYLFTTVMLWTVILLPNAQAQTPLEDTLSIFNQEELFIKIASDNIHQLKQSEDIYNLISDFKNNLNSVIKQIPRYDIFTISYVKNQSLKVEKVKGTVKYQVENNEMVKAHNQSSVHLTMPNLQVTFYINELEDLLTRNYESMIKDAFSKVKKGFQAWRNVNSPYNEYFYSFSKGKMIDGYERIKFRNRVGLVVGGTIGFFKSKPVYELTIGLGYKFGVKNNRMFYVFLGQLFQYNPDLNRPEVANLYGIGLKPSNRSSFSVALVQTETFKTENSPTRFDDVNFRTSVTVYPTKGVSVSAHFYFGDFFEDDRIDAFPTVSFGFGF